MEENNFSFKKRINSSKLSSTSKYSNNSNNSLKSINSNKQNTQFKKTKKLKYFEIYNQVKEEIKKNYKDKKKPNTTYGLKRQNLLDNLYLTSTNQINNFFDKNYSNIEIQGTKDLEDIYKKDLSSKVKNNQNNFIEIMPLKYRNPELNKNCAKINCTPIPYMQHKDNMNSFEKKELDKTIQKAIFIRKMEYTHAKPPPKSSDNIEFQNNKEKCFGYYYINIIKAAKLIQKWYRFIKKNRINNKKIRLKNKNRFISILDDENCNYNKDIILIEQNLKEKNNQYNLNETDNKLKPINKNCYISKGDLILLNNCPDMDNLIIIQRNIKNFLKNKNKISPYQIFKQIIKNKFEKKDSITKELNNSSEINFGDFSNNSENIFSKIRIISNLNSSQSIHNMTIQENEKKISNDFFKEIENKNESNSFSNNQIIYDNDNYDNNNNDSNLLNFSFNSEKNKNKSKKEKAKIIQIKKNYNKQYYISKNIYYNNTELIVKLKDLQSNIKNFLQKNNIKNNNIYTENSSEINEKNNQDKYLIENNCFLIHPEKNNDKTKILKLLLNKYNKKLNKEVDNNISLYHYKNDERNKIIKITKKKLAITLMKILNHHLKIIFNDIYQYENIYYRRKKILLNIFNNIISKLKRYFYRWSTRPLKLLIYKSKSSKYYNSLFTINNNIKKLFHSIYIIFIAKYFYQLILYYLFMNNINIINNKNLSFLNNKKKLKLFIEISKNIEQNKKENYNKNNINIIEYFKALENLNINGNNTFKEEI